MFSKAVLVVSLLSVQALGRNDQALSVDADGEIHKFNDDTNLESVTPSENYPEQSIPDPVAPPGNYPAVVIEDDNFPEPVQNSSNGHLGSEKPLDSSEGANTPSAEHGPTKKDVAAGADAKPDDELERASDAAAENMTQVANESAVLRPISAKVASSETVPKAQTNAHNVHSDWSVENAMQKEIFSELGLGDSIERAVAGALPAAKTKTNDAHSDWTVENAMQKEILRDVGVGDTIEKAIRVASSEAHPNEAANVNDVRFARVHSAAFAREHPENTTDGSSQVMGADRASSNMGTADAVPAQDASEEPISRNLSASLLLSFALFLVVFFVWFCTAGLTVATKPEGRSNSFLVEAFKDVRLSTNEPVQTRTKEDILADIYDQAQGSQPRTSAMSGGKGTGQTRTREDILAEVYDRAEQSQRPKKV